jgi:hypothetical protein
VAENDDIELARIVLIEDALSPAGPGGFAYRPMI